MPAARQMVVFLCADNSVRSQMGEMLLRHRAGDRVEVTSAGLTPKPVHPLVREVLGEIGVETESPSSRSIGTILGKQTVRYAVILRDPDETDAPRIFPFATRTLRWDVGNPVSSDATAEQERQRFRSVRDDIDARVRTLVDEITERRPSSAA